MEHRPALKPELGEIFRAEGSKFVSRMALYVASLTKTNQLDSSFAEAFANTWSSTGDTDTWRALQATVFSLFNSIFSMFGRCKSFFPVLHSFALTV